MLLLVCDVFECMLWLLVFVDGVFWVDVVVFLLCILNVVDVVLFKQIGGLVGGLVGVLGIIGVVFCVDEIGVGCIDVMFLVNDVVKWFICELNQMGICQVVVLVFGFFVLIVCILCQIEFIVLCKLVGVECIEFNRVLLSVDCFVCWDSLLLVDVGICV